MAKAPKSKLKIYLESSIILAFFLTIGITRSQSTGITFYIFNFGYIGLALATGNALWELLPKNKKIWGRRFSQLLVGLYMLGFLGFIGYENMQIEGFFYYLLAGIFAGATLHYFIAKIVGPVIFGRGWCGWACWTAMVLDFLPWTQPQGRIRRLGFIRYFHFFISMAIVLILWFGFNYREFGRHRIVELYWLIIGNILYYGSAVILAWRLKDNRAFCKIVCPIPTFQKLSSRFALMKMSIDSETCTQCGLCEKNCPMDIQLLEYMRQGRRILSTECILCQTCTNVCPVDAVSTPLRLDVGFKEYLQYRK